MHATTPSESTMGGCTHCSTSTSTYHSGQAISECILDWPIMHPCIWELQFRSLRISISAQPFFMATSVVAPLLLLFLISSLQSSPCGLWHPDPTMLRPKNSMPYWAYYLIMKHLERDQQNLLLKLATGLPEEFLKCAKQQRTPCLVWLKHFNVLSNCEKIVQMVKCKSAWMIKLSFGAKGQHPDKWFFSSPK